MLRSIDSINGYTITDRNGEAVGQVYDFYFDDHTWTIRYLVVDTGVWLPGRKVLISPQALGEPEWGGGVSLPVNLTKEEIENSPPVDVDRPVSRQSEAALSGHYGWPAYWNDVTFFDANAVGMPAETYVRSRQDAAEAEAARPVTAEPQRELVTDPDLRSIEEVTNYYIQASDGDIGHVDDFVIDTANWTIQYMIIDTRNWWPGKRVLIAPTWIANISWEESKVYVDLTRETIKNAPEYDPATPVNREYESRLYDYYGRPYYWP